MPFSSRLDLRATVRNWLALTTEVSDATVDDWINLGEADINKNLRVLDREETTSINVATETVAVPVDFRAFSDLYLTTSPRRRVRLATEEAVRVMQAIRPSGGPPSLVAIKGDSDDDKVMVFGPIPATIYTGQLTYFKSFTIDTPAGVALMQRWPNLWLYGTLIHAGDYLADARKAQWEQAYLEAIDEVIAEDTDSRWGVGTARASAAPQ